MKIKECLPQLIGRTITGIVVTSGSHPRSQLILTFLDGTAMEFWCDEGPLQMGSALDSQSLDEIVAAAKRRPHIAVSVFRPAHQDQAKPQRELL